MYACSRSNAYICMLSYPRSSFPKAQKFAQGTEGQIARNQRPVHPGTRGQFDPALEARTPQLQRPVLPGTRGQRASLIQWSAFPSASAISLVFPSSHSRYPGAPLQPQPSACDCSSTSSKSVARVEWLWLQQLVCRPLVAPAVCHSISMSADPAIGL
ncbi:hypothetical protein GJAV_G00056990 [Gymnothorax javanicus]|nr:hypothetical protein GJAV_G00056990 [Gymnothorax javanicus]